MITKLIFDWARRTPEKPALIYSGRALSYRSFAQHIALAQSYFARRGYAGPGYAVLAVYNLLDFWILSLALRDLGLTTIAVGTAAALEELDLPDVRCVITVASEHWPKLPGLCATRDWTLLSVSLQEKAKSEPTASITKHPPGGHILLTSGTTGSARMVLMSPETDATFLPRVAEWLKLNQDTIMSVFDFPLWTAAGYRMAAAAWLAGGAVLIEQSEKIFQPLLHPAITHATVTPTLLDLILAAPADAFARNDRLQLIVTAGSMTQAQVDAAKARITPRVYNLVSSTEGSAIALTLLETPEDHRWHSLVPGRRVEIVDGADHPVPMGETGLIRVSTEGGPSGYLHNAAATHEFFKDGYFYPGDLAVMRADGRIALQGRATDVINVRGDKILPAPIENRLSEALGVSGVCLFSMQSGIGEEEIYVVLEGPREIERQRLDAAIQRELKAFPKVHVYCLARFPRNPMGKMLRPAIRAQVLQREPGRI